jgi:hypothetical protein
VSLRLARYTPPVGTTDLVLSKLANIAHVQADTLGGTVITDAGPVERPTAMLHDMEALLIRRYVIALRKRHKEPRLFHRWCWRGNPRVEHEAIAMAISPERIVMVCGCRTIFHQRSRVVPSAAMKVM